MLKSPPLAPLTSLTAGLLVGAVLSSITVSADAADFGFGSSGPSKPSVSETATPATSFASYGRNVPMLLADPEVSPDELAKELGLPQSDDEPFAPGHGLSRTIPQTRVVAPEHFQDFRVNVDVFRRSTKRPVLGEYRDEYATALVPNSEGMSDAERTTLAKKRFANLAGREFAVVSLDGVPFKAYLVSGAVEHRVAVVKKGADGRAVRDPTTGERITVMSMKTTPPGNYRLDPIAYVKKVKRPDGTTVSAPVAFPWIRSRAYNNSQMYWGLWIKGGYFIHSTPHYGELGRPASMGCIRQSFPDAQELFKLVVDRNLPAMIRIHPIGSKSAVSRLREVVLDLGYDAPEDAPVATAPRDPSKDMNWVLDQLQTNANRVRDSIGYYGSELNLFGHEWLDADRKPPAIAWPSCGSVENGPIDCFKAWGARKPKNSLN